MIKKIKNTVLQKYVTVDINGQETAGIFYEEEFAKDKSKGF